MFRVVVKSDKSTDYPALLYSFNFEFLQSAEKAVAFFTDDEEGAITCQIIEDTLPGAVAHLKAEIAEKTDGTEDRPEEPKAD